MREITTHKGNELDDQLKILVLDEPGHGGACHRYQINDMLSYDTTEIFFQNGPVKEHGVNGISIESLLAICIDRLQGFQSGPYKCHENAMALIDVESALGWLKMRTSDRQARGVEGTSAQ
jgi:hypothetical protein